MVLPCRGNVTSMCAVKILAKYGCGSHLIHEFSSLELMGEDLQTKSISTAPCECLSHGACTYNVSTVATTSYSRPLYTVYNWILQHIYGPLVIKYNNTCENIQIALNLYHLLSDYTKVFLIVPTFVSTIRLLLALYSVWSSRVKIQWLTHTAHWKLTVLPL